MYYNWTSGIEIYTYMNGSSNDTNAAGTALPITSELQTSLMELNTTSRKFWREINFLVDEQIGSVLNIQYTDTSSGINITAGSTSRAISLAPVSSGAVKGRKNAYSFKQSRRRIWRFSHSSLTPLRIQRIELEYDIGGLEGPVNPETQ
jgi:hypothetical protein